MTSTSYTDPVSWPFLPKPQAGTLLYPSLQQSVTNAIRIILTTCPGEQLMRPRYGAGLQTFLDDGNSVTLRRQIQNAILANLQSYENRIVVDGVNVDPVPNDSSAVLIQIHYRVLRTNTAQQFGVQLQVG